MSTGDLVGPGAGGLTIRPVTGVAEVRSGDDLAGLIVAAVGVGGGPSAAGLADGDVVVVTQKIVSKAEGRIVTIDPDDPDAKRQLVESQSVRILRRRGDLLITETHHGFVCANAGVDLSNVEAGTAALLPVDADRSARRIREALEHRHGVSVGVIVSDTFGRTWRQGVTDVAIGLAGVAGVVDLRGTPDATGRVLEATEVCIADELASAAELVMGKDRGIPVAVIRGVDPRWLRPGSVATEIVRTPGEDLFR
jgi:coenzyme F420-0:L-glutamate ligase/coenzyme F420-1:gamma-L-glutamate ligase